MSQWVYRFGGEVREGHAGLRHLLGGKGANLAEMAAIGLPVPPGFTITTEVCRYFYAHERRYPPGLEQEVARALAWLEGLRGQGFGDPERPLLVSVRSGAPISMPGMMDTILNLGLNHETVEGLARVSGDRRFAFDSYRRLVQMYGEVVLGIEARLFEEELAELVAHEGVRRETELSPAALERLVERYLALVEERSQTPFPRDVRQQLWGAIGAVFGSWMNPRAVTYRRLHRIPEDMGTAVTVQSMVFGNLGEDCATGVAFTRDPATGRRVFYGEYLVNAQGEDVVAGIRTPKPLTRAMAEANGAAGSSLEERMPEVFRELERVFATLERHYRDMQDIEFTVEKGRLYVLQTRSGKRTAQAALKIAVDMVEEGLIGREEALLRVDPAALEQLLHPTLDPKAERKVLARGLPASPGAASGRVVFDADEAERRALAGEAVILVRIETSPEDIHGMHAARGILTSRGGMTSHAAVVARGMGKPCVCGASNLLIDYEQRQFTVDGTVVRRGDVITIDGSSGQVMLGEVPTIEPKLSGEFATLMAWADAVRRLKVRTNAETPKDAQTAVRFGAEGIGLCRTEHMFFQDDRIVAMREMILAQDSEGRRRALAKILPMQRGDFVALFRIMGARPVTIRLLDPPLHEFLPFDEEELEAVAAAGGFAVAALKRRLAELKEANPMLGLRGCRLGIVYPEIYEMQARAIFEAALEVARTDGVEVVPEIMIPLVATARELELLRDRVARVAKAVAAEQGRAPRYLLGTMIELPRAALRAEAIARHAEFFSFGTNDLTQMTLGISRDDAVKFLEAYQRAGVFPTDPFQSLDVDGVGELVRMAVERGRRARADLKLGICGEHGGDPDSIAFCEALGLDYVSCSPYRVPIARLAAAQAVLRRDPKWTQSSGSSNS